MMLLIYNLVAVPIVLLSIMAVFVLNGIFHFQRDNLYLLSLGLSLLVFDLVARFVVIKRFFPNSKMKGGTLFFIPVFVIGILLSIYSFFFKP